MSALETGVLYVRSEKMIARHREHRQPRQPVETPNTSISCLPPLLLECSLLSAKVFNVGITSTQNLDPGSGSFEISSSLSSFKYDGKRKHLPHRFPDFLQPWIQGGLIRKWVLVATKSKWAGSRVLKLTAAPKSFFAVMLEFRIPSPPNQTRSTTHS